jgi:tryptophanyl-tRNA synthetase
MKRLLTGIKPTGDIHVANYFAAIRPAVEMQGDYESFVFLADLHALNQVSDPKKLARDTMEIAKAYLAAGLDPEQVCLFQQSRLPHAELSVLLSSSTGLGLLERAHAYKDAVAKGKSINVGTFYYPVLMAADILMYDADVVPVGKDQKQHVEIAREIAQRFNHTYGHAFVVPEELIREDIASVPGLDGRKMSKSYDNVIGLFDDAATVSKKVSRIVTDSKRPEEAKDPETDTIFQIYRLVAPEADVAALRGAYLAGGMSYKEAKDRLAAALNAFLDPMRAKKAELDANEDYVRDVLEAGAMRARQIAEPKMEMIRQLVGLSNV